MVRCMGKLHEIIRKHTGRTGVVNVNSGYCYILFNRIFINYIMKKWCIEYMAAYKHPYEICCISARL